MMSRFSIKSFNCSRSESVCNTSLHDQLLQQCSPAMLRPVTHKVMRKSWPLHSQFTSFQTAFTRLINNNHNTRLNQASRHSSALCKYRWSILLWERWLLVLELTLILLINLIIHIAKLAKPPDGSCSPLAEFMNLRCQLSSLKDSSTPWDQTNTNCDWLVEHSSLVIRRTRDRCIQTCRISVCTWRQYCCHKIIQHSFVRQIPAVTDLLLWAHQFVLVWSRSRKRQKTVKDKDLYLKSTRNKAEVSLRSISFPAVNRKSTEMRSWETLWNKLLSASRARLAHSILASAQTNESLTSGLESCWRRRAALLRIGGAVADIVRWACL